MNTEGKYESNKSVMIMIFVEFINQLIDYPINCATLGASADKSLKQAHIPTPFATHQSYFRWYW